MDNELKNLFSSSLKYLGYRPRSKKEILDFLKKKTSDNTLINQTIEKLEKLKLINDEDFTTWLIKSRSRNRGSIFIKQDLKKYGIDTNNIETNDLQTAILLLTKKMPQWSKLGANDLKQKAYRYLTYRGIPGSVIAQALKKIYNNDNVS